MSFQMPPDPSEPRPGRTRRLTNRRRGRALLPTIVVVVVVLAVYGIFTNFYTDLLWFRSVGFAQVFTTQLATKAVLFVLGALFMGGVVALNLVIAFRNRPSYVSLSPDQRNLDRYRHSIEPFRRLIVITAAVLLGLLSGSASAGRWQTYLLWRHGVAFGTKDPQFHKDISFFAFDLPWYRFLLNLSFTVVVVSLLATVATHYLYGGLRLQAVGPHTDRTTSAARIHLSVLLGIFLLLKAVAYLVDRYELVTQEGKVGNATGFVGGTYTDINAVLPAKAILAGIALIVALLFFANAVRRNWLLPGMGSGLLLLAAIIMGGIYPAVVQRFTVNPSEQEKEAHFIERNIVGTRDAYDIADAEVTKYEPKTVASQGANGKVPPLPQIRLLDPAVVSPAFRQLAQDKGFYGFPDTLDVDRYQVGGKLQDSVVAVRELVLSGLRPEQRGWINEHLNYTHGFGMVAAKGDAVGPHGEPDFLVQNISPAPNKLGDYQPRIYFGEQSPGYSIVGGSAGKPSELDYPDDSAPSGQENNTYDGKGGVDVSSVFRQVLYATKFQEAKILLSDRIGHGSKILYDRTPRERVEKVAPWLKLDGNAYPAVVGKKIVWVLDGYTVSNNYPYSSRESLSQATEDTLTSTRAVVAQEDQRVNYMRNSVKATVDAYDGTVTLYQWDDDDPVLKSWMKTFPGSVHKKSDIDPELLAHLRYPEDLFKVQRTLLARYHVTDPRAFFSGQDFWRIPVDPALSQDADVKTEQPPYYLTLQMPGQKTSSFSLTTTFVPQSTAGAGFNLASFAAVDAEAGSKDYGKIRILELPRTGGIKSPGQVQNDFRSSYSSTLNLLRGTQGSIHYGNLLTLPVSGGLLYVEPVYVQGTGSSGTYPLLRKVLVSDGDKIGFDDTLQGALQQVFSGTAPSGGEAPVPGSETPPTATPSPSTSATVPAVPPADLAAALTDIEKAYDDSRAALAAPGGPDWAKFGEAQKRLESAVQRAQALEARGAGPKASARPAPSATGGAG